MYWIIYQLYHRIVENKEKEAWNGPSLKKIPRPYILFGASFFGSCCGFESGQLLWLFSFFFFLSLVLSFSSASLNRSLEWVGATLLLSPKRFLAVLLRVNRIYCARNWPKIQHIFFVNRTVLQVVFYFSTEIFVTSVMAAYNSSA